MIFKARKKQERLQGKRGSIPNRVGIKQRPVIVGEKKELDYWESDTIIGGNHLGILVTHVDEASKFLVAGLAKNMNKITSKLFENAPQEKLKTLTCDNGKEFSYHE